MLLQIQADTIQTLAIYIFYWIHVPLFLAKIDFQMKLTWLASNHWWGINILLNMNWNQRTTYYTHNSLWLLHCFYLITLACCTQYTHRNTCLPCLSELSPFRTGQKQHLHVITSNIQNRQTAFIPTQQQFNSIMWCGWGGGFSNTPWAFLTSEL